MQIKRVQIRKEAKLLLFVYDTIQKILRPPIVKPSLKLSEAQNQAIKLQDI